MELDFDKYCKLSESPNTVLPPLCQQSKADKRRSTKREITSKNNLFSLEEDFEEINNFHRFRSISCKNVPSRTSRLEGNEVLRRGSVYQSSNEKTKTKNNEDFKGRRKIELSEKDSIFSSFGILDSLCSSDEDSPISKNSLNLIFNCGKEHAASLERDKMESTQFREASIGLHKSLTAKLAIPKSSFQSENDSSMPSSPKSRFGIKKMFDPFTKSKSTRNNDRFRKSLLSDFSKTMKVVESVFRESSISCSPVHLHGFLKLKTRHGTPFFEFSLNFPIDVLVARRWKAENGLNWVYTFHSKDLKKGSSMVGQMQVACYSRTNTKGGEAFDDSMITEFSLCDVTKHKDYDKSAKKSIDIAAIVVQVPYEKRESLKHKGGDKTSLLDLCEIRERKGINNDFSFNVVVPLGAHGLPNADVMSCGPSSLLERWRSNGGCDCGGWDMGCPLTVFGNEDIRSVDERLIWENRRPFELFVKGGKDNTPSLVITAIDEGCYNVDFHAKLSTLQAFSICLAMLHCTEASTTTADEREKPMPESDSLRVFVDEEISDLIKAAAAKKKRKDTKKMGEKLPSFKMKPPFSPIARV